MSGVRPPRSVHRATLPGLPRSLRDDGKGLDELTELAPGSQLLHSKSFDIVDRIGEGGMGKIYRAYDPRMDRYVALKVLKLDVPDAAQRRFRREALVAADFSHPNLPRVLDVGYSEQLGIEWLTMEYLRGRDLGEVIDRGRPVTVPLLVDMVGQVLDALAYIHVRKIVHCDVKPDNIFITRDPYNRRLVIVKLIDFGVCRTLDPPEEQTEISGDPRYMAPEQTTLEGPFDHRADFYSLGITLYEMLTGQTVFRGSHMNILTQHVYVAPISPRERAPDAGIPSDLDDLLMRMLAKRPDQRPTAEALVDALHSVQGTLAGQRHRGRDDRMLQGRAARMISIPEQPAPTIDHDAVRRAAAEAQEDLRVGLVGEFGEDLWLGLASNGLAPDRLDASMDPVAAGCDVVLAVVDDLDRISALVGSDVPVVAVPPASRVELLAELLRRGVSDVLAQPLEVDELARKLRRAVSRARRQRRRNR
ncbi:MAG: serine/threonine protein kinase [Myxococcales bacterium]|nr:serine/threonine protein kinase [Myxococcales bacterium]